MNRSRLRLIFVLVLAFPLGACAGAQQATNVAPTQPATSTPALSQPTDLPSATPQPTSASPSPSATPQPTPTATPTPTAAPTATAIPAATATPARSRTPQPATQEATAFHYVFPVRSEGKINYGRYHHDYPAVDIFCPVGSEFVAVTGGVVDFVSREDTWTPAINDGATRGGLSVAIIGDDGVRYYGSHLSQVADGISPGVRVEAGQLLGRTGKSGDARYTDAHLHFGISHPTVPEDWEIRRGEVPPYNYLRAWQRGEDVTPEIP
jgi:peptidoglycan LD-endopeptidase LytH